MVLWERENNVFRTWIKSILDNSVKMWRPCCDHQIEIILTKVINPDYTVTET